MENLRYRTARSLVFLLIITLVSPIVASESAHAANPACTPTQTTVNGRVVLEFDNPNTNDSNTTGGNVGYTCDWTVPANVYNVEVVIVGGGGSGGNGNQGGGGGGGEVLYTNSGYSLTPASVKTITIGSGGAPARLVSGVRGLNAANLLGNSGAPSVFDGILSHGGGGGGAGNEFAYQDTASGVTGGSSGGDNRFGRLQVNPTKTVRTGWTSLANQGGQGEGKGDNVAATSSTCDPFGAGGGGGGAMSAGTSAVATCSDSSTAGTLSIVTGAGGAGAYLMGACLGGGGGSVYATGNNRAASPNIVAGGRVECIDPKTNASVSGSASGGGSGFLAGSGLPNTGGGGSGAPYSNSLFTGGSGVVLVSYDPTFPPVAPVFTTDLQDTTVVTQSLTYETVVATVNDGGTISYSWRKKAPGSNTWVSFSAGCIGQNVCPFLSDSITDSGTVYQAIATNRRSGQEISTYSRAMTFSVVARDAFLSFSYPDTNTATYFSGETLTSRVQTNHPLISSGVYTTTSSATICTVNSTTGVISVTGGGACIIRLSIPGDRYWAAISRVVTVNIAKIPQSVSWSSLPNIKINGGPITLGVTSGYPLATGATASGSGSLSYSASGCNKFSVTSSGVITPLALGTCSIRATQSATNYYAEGYREESLTVSAAAPDAPFINSISATGGSTPTSGAVTVNFTDNGENGATITRYVLRAVPTSGTTIYDTETVGAGTHSGTITGLTLGTSYTISMEAVNSVGASIRTTYPTQVTPAGAPNAVSGLSATPGNGSLTISYSQPASLNGGTWTEYQYFITPGGISFSDTPTATDSNQSHTSYTFTGLTNGTAYNIKVVAITTANGSPNSANTTLLNMVPASAPNAPSLSITQVSATSVTINWSSLGDGGSAITAYAITVQKNGTNQACYVNLATTYCTLTGLSGLDQISVSATATNVIGTSSATTASLSVIGTVAIPTGITVEAGDTVLTIKFSQPNSGDAIATYQYTFDGSTYVDACTSASPVVITGLTNDTTYTLFIRAIGSIYGAGLLTDTITGTPTVYVDPPAAPPSYSISTSPVQSSNITGSQPPFGYFDTTTIVIVTGAFPTPVTSITINAIAIDRILWNQTQNSLTIIMQPHAVETVTIQVINGLTPTLPAFTFAYIKRTEVSPQAVVPPSEKEITDSGPATPGIKKITIRLKVPFRKNSYFLNDAAKREIALIAKKYKALNVQKIIATGFVSSGARNPYPKFLGVWRSKVIRKQLIVSGVKAKVFARYGGIARGNPANALRGQITIYLTVK